MMALLRTIQNTSERRKNLEMISLDDLKVLLTREPRYADVAPSATHKLFTSSSGVDSGRKHLYTVNSIGNLRSYLYFFWFCKSYILISRCGDKLLTLRVPLPYMDSISYSCEYATQHILVKKKGYIPNSKHNTFMISDICIKILIYRSVCS